MDDQQRAVIGYIRVSTTGQAREGVSLEAQRSAITDWADSEDHHLLEIYEDPGYSGGRADNRPGLQDAVQRAVRESGVLVVYSLSRLSRSVLDTLRLVRKLEEAGADLVSLSDQHIDTTSPMGEFIFNIFAALNQLERKLVSERTRRALAHKKRNNERVGTIPYGWKLGEDGSELVPVPDEQEGIELILDLRERGCSYHEIAGELEERGFSPKRGEQWWRSSVRSIHRRAVQQQTGEQPA